MLKNFFLLTLRTLVANRLFTAINIIGLAIGLACVILIALFVRHETSFDQHWQNSDRTYKVMRTFLAGQSTPELRLATNAPQTGPLLAQDFPEFEHVVRLQNTGQLLISDPESNQSFYEFGLLFADPNVYEIFDMPMLSGQWEGALDAPMQMVINETLAAKYFPNGDAVGGSLLVAGQAPVEITGVIEDLPDNTHLNAQGFVSISTLLAMFGDGFLVNWASNNYHTYVLTPENYGIQTFIDEIPGFMNRHIGEQATDFTDFVVMPLTDIHLHSQRDNELDANGNIVTVVTFSAIAVVILLIACFNFMNLSTARSASRAREVGLRKTLGADKRQIALQFLGESVLLSVIAIVMAALVVAFVLAWFNNLVGLNLSFNPLNDPLLGAGLLVLAVAVGLVAGSYPAFYLSSYSVSRILKGELTKGSGGANLRKFLVVTQFSISIALVIASGIALSQLRYALSMDPGFTKDQILLVRGNGIDGLGTNYQTMKQELLAHPEILSVTAANLMPGDQNTNSTLVRYEGGDPQGLGMPYLNVDYDFFETFDIDISLGRSFSEERGTDLTPNTSVDNPIGTGAYILNQHAAEQIGYTPEEALGKWFEVSMAQGFEQRVRGPIVGIADNIFFSSIREAVKPVYYAVREHDNPNGNFPRFGQMAVRMSGRDVSDTVGFIESTWENFLPGAPVRHEFMDRKFEELYQSEQTQSRIFTAFSFMAIFIAGLGLFGLASFLTEQRTKEIGVRKVLGSSVMDIVALLTKDFTKLVLIANLIAWPIAWYFMNGWLENFAYRVSMGVGIFFFAALLAWLIAALTVGSLAAITANLNPTLSLRHE
ncbi:MAG: FtsX-like permease family protein [Pseudomonadales bacterium]|nr:FtsX-like permease family protein [Pseudomonadales bacterium]